MDQNTTLHLRNDFVVSRATLTRANVGYVHVEVERGAFTSRVIGDWMIRLGSHTIEGKVNEHCPKDRAPKVAADLFMRRAALLGVAM